MTEQPLSVACSLATFGGESKSLEYGLNLCLPVPSEHSNHWVTVILSLAQELSSQTPGEDSQQ